MIEPPKYDPASDQDKKGLRARTPEEIIAQNAVILAAREELCHAIDRFMEFVNRDAVLRATLEQSSTYGQLPVRLSQLVKKMREGRSVNFPRLWLENMLMPPVSPENEALPPAAPKGFLARFRSTPSPLPENCIHTALDESGLRAVCERIRDGLDKAMPAWDVDALLRAGATFAEQVSLTEIRGACEHLRKGAQARNQQQFSKAALASRMKDESQTKPRSIFDAAELFSHVSRRCGFHRAIHQQLDDGLGAAHALAAPDASEAPFVRSLMFWGRVQSIRELAVTLSNTRTRALMDEMAAEEGGAVLKKVLAAYDTSQLAQTARMVFEKDSGITRS